MKNLGVTNNLHKLFLYLLMKVICGVREPVHCAWHGSSRHIGTIYNILEVNMAQTRVWEHCH